VHELHCSCAYHADSFYIAHSPLHCDETIDSNFTIEPKYIINLPYVHAFLGKSILDMVEEDDIFNMSIPIKLPKLAIAEKLYQDRISLDQQKSFDLATVINQTQSDKKVFAGLGHLLLNNLLDAHLENSDFDLLNPFTWVQLIFGLIGTLALILAIFLYCRLKTVMLLLARSPYSAAFPLIIELPSTTTVQYATYNNTLNYFDYHDKFLELVPIDVSFLLCFLLFCFLYLLRYCKKCIQEMRNRNIRTILWLELTNHSEILSFEISNLQYTASSYRFIVNFQDQPI